MNACPTQLLDQSQCFQNFSTWNSTTPWSTTMAISNLTSNVVYSRHNFSILSVSNLSKPSPVQVSPSDIMKAFEIIFPPTLNQANVNTTEATLLIYVNAYLATITDSTKSLGNSYLRALLTLPLLNFQINGLGPNVSDSQLPPAFNTSAELAKAVQRAFIPNWTVFIYSVITSFVFIWCIGGMLVALFIPTPISSRFELIDFASTVIASPDSSIPRSMIESAGGPISTLRERLQDKTLVVPDVHSMYMSLTSFPQVVGEESVSDDSQEVAGRT